MTIDETAMLRQQLADAHEREEKLLREVDGWAHERDVARAAAADRDKRIKQIEASSHRLPAEGERDDNIRWLLAEVAKLEKELYAAQSCRDVARAAEKVAASECRQALAERAAELERKYLAAIASSEAGSKTALGKEQARANKAEKFKAFVHSYLDQHGVPHGDPDNEHQRAGCRIGARLDWLFTDRDDWRERAELALRMSNRAEAAVAAIREVLKYESPKDSDDIGPGYMYIKKAELFDVASEAISRGLYHDY